MREMRIIWTASIPSKGDRYDPYRRTPFPDHCPHSGHLDPDFAAIVELRRCHLPNRDRPYWAEWHLPFRQLTPRPSILPGAGTGRRAACRCSLWVKDGLAIQHQRRPLSVVATGDKMVRRGERSHVPIATNALQQTASLFNHFIGASEQLRVSISPPLMQPPPNGRRVGIRIVTFEACSGFTPVPARRIAQPPKAAFVTRLQPCRLPDKTARQLPDQSTTLWVESSSTSDPRLRGALP